MLKIRWCGADVTLLVASQSQAYLFYLRSLRQLSLSNILENLKMLFLIKNMKLIFDEFNAACFLRSI